MTLRSLYFAFSLCLACTALPAAAKPSASEMPGASDHPLVSRYSGAVLENAADERFEAVRVPAGPARLDAGSKLGFDKAIQVEGRVRSYFYVGPDGRTALEVFRNYQTALSQAGFSALYSCEMRACDKSWIREYYADEVVRPRKWASGRGNAYSAISNDVRFISAKLSRNGADHYVLLFVAEPDSIWKAPTTVLLVVEPAAMVTGNVVVSTDALQKGMAAEGRIALYGIYFDTGRAELKPESKAQIDQMAQYLAPYLAADKRLRIAIVGHTDNEGSVDSNLALSRRRAEAVVAALVSQHRIDANRLMAQGVAAFSPVASNRNEAGRARNRRVEMVEQ